jgi:hypothetical protein
MFGIDTQTTPSGALVTWDQGIGFCCEVPPTRDVVFMEPDGLAGPAPFGGIGAPTTVGRPFTNANNQLVTVRGHGHHVVMSTWTESGGWSDAQVVYTDRHPLDQGTKPHLPPGGPRLHHPGRPRHGPDAHPARQEPPPPARPRGHPLPRHPRATPGRSRPAGLQTHSYAVRDTHMPMRSRVRRPTAASDIRATRPMTRIQPVGHQPVRCPRVHPGLGCP